jgi:hypothetical protein
MSLHPALRALSILLRPLTSGGRDAEAALIAGNGAPSGGVLDNGQSLAAGQVALRVQADAPAGASPLHVSADGGTSWSRVPAEGVPGTRFSLSHRGGARGKPGLNADIQNSAEATRMIADPDFELQGTNAASSSSSFNAEGGIDLTTAGADGDQVILAPHVDTNQSAWNLVTWGTDKSVAWECWIETGASIANAVIWAGLKLTNTSVTATDDDQVFFRYEDDVNDGEWEAVSSIGGTDDEHDTGIAVAADTVYHLQIVIDATRVARFYINGTLVETTDALTDATDLVPYIGVEADGAAAAKAITYYGQDISRIAG